MRSGDRGIWSENLRYSLALKCASCVKGIGGFEAKIFVIRPEDVYKYIERAKTEIENDHDLMEKFAEFQPKTIFF